MSSGRVVVRKTCPSLLSAGRRRAPRSAIRSSSLETSSSSRSGRTPRAAATTLDLRELQREHHGPVLPLRGRSRARPCRRARARGRRGAGPIVAEPRARSRRRLRCEQLGAERVRARRRAPARTRRAEPSPPGRDASRRRAAPAARAAPRPPLAPRSAPSPCRTMSSSQLIEVAGVAPARLEHALPGAQRLARSASQSVERRRRRRRARADRAASVARARSADRERKLARMEHDRRRPTRVGRERRRPLAVDARARAPPAQADASARASSPVLANPRPDAGDLASLRDQLPGRRRAKAPRRRERRRPPRAGCLALPVVARDDVEPRAQLEVDRSRGCGSSRTLSDSIASDRIATLRCASA